MIGFLLAFLSRLLPTTAGGTAASEWGIGSLLTRGAGIAPTTGINAAQTLTYDVDCAGNDQLDIFTAISGGAVGDLTVVVAPYRGAANATIIPGMTAPEIRHTGPTFSGATVSHEAEYDVSGYSRVRVSITNNNVGAQAITEATWRLS